MGFNLKWKVLSMLRMEGLQQNVHKETCTNDFLPFKFDLQGSKSFVTIRMNQGYQFAMENTTHGNGQGLKRTHCGYLSRVATAKIL